MDTRQQQLLQNFRQTLAWSADSLTGQSAGTGIGVIVAPASPIAQHLTALQLAVVDATAFAAEHEGLDRAVRGLGAEAYRPRRELVSHQMVHVATIARTAIPDVAKMTEALRTPRRTRKTEALLATAEAMAKAGEQYKVELVVGGLSADFPDQLRGVAAALKEVIDARKVNVVNRRGASKAFDEAIGRGRKAVDALTILVKRELRDHPTLVAEWMQLRRVPKAGVRHGTGSVAPVTAAPTAPVQQVVSA